MGKYKTSKMFIRILVLICCCLYHTQSELYKSPEPHCLTGYMTDMQSWVAADGVLNSRYVDNDNAVDLSYMTNPVPVLERKMTSMRSYSRSVKYLSLAKCELTRIPLIFQMTDHMNRHISETLEYMTFYGNNFVSVSLAGKEYDVFFNATSATENTSASNLLSQDITNVWSSGIERADFPVLKELDLRSCSIQALTSGVFRRLTNLEALYIGENQILQINEEAFIGLSNLYHLDLSRNQPVDEKGNTMSLMSDSFYTFGNLTNLVSLDLSHTKLSPRNFGMIRGLGKNLKRLSLCNTGLLNLQKGIFNRTSLEILDISRNPAILYSGDGLQGLEHYLIVLFATEAGLQTMDVFRNFSKVEILQLSNNEVSNMTSGVARSLKSLQVLDLNKNRILSWFNTTYSLIPNLKLLSLKENNINIISEQMISDMINIEYIALAGNFLVCNCHVKDFYRMAAANEKQIADSCLKSPRKRLYHTGYEFYNEMITNRNTVVYNCDEEDCDNIEDLEFTGTFRLVDEGSYRCLKVPEQKSVPFSNVSSCNIVSRDKAVDDELLASRNTLLALLVIPILLVPLVFIYIFRRNLKYCCITMRNSAMLGLINKNEAIDDGTLFNYDVFVSYCNEDRGWVLDHLLPHMEAECSISACLHERDFQVGLSILENIVSCMDRSRSIMLIISQQFLLSQWCQFEMHLAQHRLLETRREDLILVLLEDIPRRVRPNTLHYLMLTKTYIVWPKVKSERVIFWRRLKKSLISQTTKQSSNVSLA